MYVMWYSLLNQAQLIIIVPTYNTMTLATALVQKERGRKRRQEDTNEWKQERWMKEEEKKKSRDF